MHQALRRLGGQGASKGSGVSRWKKQSGAPQKKQKNAQQQQQDKDSFARLTELADQLVSCLTNGRQLVGRRVRVRACGPGRAAVRVF